jgi:hypothetical protein
MRTNKRNDRDTSGRNVCPRAATAFELRHHLKGGSARCSLLARTVKRPGRDGVGSHRERPEYIALPHQIRRRILCTIVHIAVVLETNTANRAGTRRRLNVQAFGRQCGQTNGGTGNEGLNWLIRVLVHEHQISHAKGYDSNRHRRSRSGGRTLTIGATVRSSPNLVNTNRWCPGHVVTSIVPIERKDRTILCLLFCIVSDSR